MKLKTLRKKIRRIESRIQKDSTKLAKLRRRLDATAATKARKAQKGAATRALARQTAGPLATPPNQDALTEKLGRIAAVGTKSGAAPKVRKRPEISPERRAQLSEAMKARWAARRAASAARIESAPAALSSVEQPQEISMPPNVIPAQIPSAS